jgi:tetratricopeptide (TPR) repeat protein
MTDTDLTERFIVVFIIAWLSAAAWVLYYWRFNRFLARKQPELLETLGDLPELNQRFVTMGEIRSLFRLAGFLLKQEYLRIPNPELIKWGRTGRRIFLLNIASLLLLAAMLPGLINQETASPGAASATARQTGTSIATEAERLYQNNRFNEALALLDQVLITDPDNANLLYWRGLTNEKLGNNSNALADFAGVVAQVPDHFSSYQHLDYLLFQQGRTDEIITWWDQYLTAKPDDADAYLERGGTWFRIGNRDNAAADARRACELGNQEGCQRYTQVTGQSL